MSPLRDLHMALLGAWWAGVITAREALAIRRVFVAHGEAVEIRSDRLTAAQRDALDRVCKWDNDRP